MFAIMMRKVKSSMYFLVYLIQCSVFVTAVFVLMLNEVENEVIQIPPSFEINMIIYCSSAPFETLQYFIFHPFSSTLLPKLTEERITASY